jgi:hypothetical protein
VGAGSSSGITGVSGLAVSNLGFSSTVWKNKTVCSRQQAVTMGMALQEGVIADGSCS